MSRPIGSNSESRPSDLWTNGSKPTIPRSGSSGPTMRVKEVAAAPGAKTRSHLQLMQNTHRAATGGWTSSSIHPPDSHILHGTRAPDNNNGVGFPLQEGNGGVPASSTSAYLDPAVASNPLENNLRQQRDLLASQMDMMRQSRENYPPQNGSPTNNNQNGGQPLVGALPPLTAPYGSQCSASQPPFSAVGKYNTTYLGNQIGGGVVPNRLGSGPSSTALLQKKINSGTTAAGSKKAREEIESLQAALQEQNDEMDRLRSENEQLRNDFNEARRSADEIASHQDDSEQRVHAAQRGMDRAREMQRRAEVALEHQSETIDSIQKESMMYRLEWERCLEFMAKFGGIGKDYHNNHSGEGAVDMSQEALMEASKRHLTEDDGVTDENCAELVNRILQGDHSLVPPVCGNGSEAGGGSGVLYPVSSQNAVDPATASNGMVGIESGPPHRLVLGDSPHGTEGGGVVCGRLGLVALTHRLLQEHANVVSQLKASRERNHSLLISLQQVNQREAHSAAEMVAMENEFQKAQERLRVGEVLLADVRGEAEYLRGIVGEHTETISRLMREVSGLQARVRDQVGQRAAAEGRVDAAEDTAKKASHDITQREMIFKKSISEMQYDMKCLDARLLEAENARAAISHEKDHIAYQLNHVRTNIAKKLDGLLEAGTGRDTGEAVRQAQERAAREAGQLAQTIASLRNDLFDDCPAPPPPPPFMHQPHHQHPNTSFHAPHDNFPPDASSHQPVDYRAHPQQQQHSHNTSYHQPVKNNNNNHPGQPVDYTATSHQHNNPNTAPAPPPPAPGGVSLYHGSIKEPKGNVDPSVALTEASSSKEHRREAAEARAAAQSQIQTKNSQTSSSVVNQPAEPSNRVSSTPPQPHTKEDAV